MIVLAFNRSLSREAQKRLQHEFKLAEERGNVIVVEDCTVLSDTPADLACIEFSDGSSAIIPKGLSREDVISALRELP